MPEPLPYHDDRDHLRRELLDNSTAYFTPAGQKEINPNHSLRITSVLGSAYAYNLAAAIQWVAVNVGGTEADGLAAWLSGSLTNGDDDGLNEDITGEAEKLTWHVIRHSDGTYGITNGEDLDWGAWAIEASAQTEADSRNRADGGAA